MLNDNLFTRLLMRGVVLSFSCIAPFAVLHTFAAYRLWPVPPLVLLTSPLPIPTVIALYRQFHWNLTLLTIYFAAEVVHLLVHTVQRSLNEFGNPKPAQYGTEERWRLWVRMVESSRDPGTWLSGWFLRPGVNRADGGAHDPALEDKLEKVGRTNIEEFVAKMMFQKPLKSIRPKSLERAELHSMVVLLEAQMAERNGAPFSFGRGRSPHRLSVPTQAAQTGHHPLLFYAIIWICSALGNLSLFLGGFRYYGPTTWWPFPAWIMRGSTWALDRALDPLEKKKMGDSMPAERVGYWYHPGSKKAQAESLSPVVYLHGLSGSFGSSLFLLRTQRLTGRAVFIPESPYLSMRLHRPSSIIAPHELVASVRFMLWKHGFGLTHYEGAKLDADESFDSEAEHDDDDDDDDEWRRGRCIVLAHSLGTNMAGWLLKYAPDVVEGTVLLDPTSVLLFSADTSRNFFRQKVTTAGEIFFKFFAAESGINHYVSKHLVWSDSALFPHTPSAPLPEPAKKAIVPLVAQAAQEVGWDVPYFAPGISPCPEGPIPSVVLCAEHDAIAPVHKILDCLTNAGFTQDGEKSLLVMPKAQHASALFSWKWSREVAEAVDRVGEAAEKYRELDE